MSAVRELTDALIAGGIHPADAAMLVARAGVEMASSGPSKAALRTRKWRAGQSSQTVTGDDSVTVEKSVTERHKPSPIVTRDDAPISNSKSLKVRERQNRGSRITPEWAPSDAERAFAKQEGFSDWEVQRETQKFRDYWTACAGAKGVKLDWSATWRQWIRNGADRAGKTPAPSGQGAAAGLLYYAKPESEQLAAWDAWAIKANGKSLPRDKNGGWNVKAEWPPEYVRPEKVREMSATPMFRSVS